MKKKDKKGEKKAKIKKITNISNSKKTTIEEEFEFFTRIRNEKINYNSLFSNEIPRPMDYVDPADFE
jgi:hypothetical protein